MYDPVMVKPMREEVTRLGVEELATAESVEQFLAREGTQMIFVNSVCGCAAGAARPGLALALDGELKPDHMGTVFAGNDAEATARARESWGDWPPSSPQIGLLRDGTPFAVIQRHEIETASPVDLANTLQAAFKACAAADKA